MSPARPPRVRGLVLALVAVVLVMGYAFWRSAARSSTDSAPPTSEPTDQAAPVVRPAAAVPPAPDANATASDADVAGDRTDASAPTPRRPSPASASKPSPGETNEAQLMARLRVIKDRDPAGAVTLAREGNRRFADSPDAPERTSVLIHALVATDKGSEARGEAEQMVNHYPDSTWVREVEHFTGAHRHRNVGVNDAGQVIFR